MEGWWELAFTILGETGSHEAHMRKAYEAWRYACQKQPSSCESAICHFMHAIAMKLCFGRRDESPHFRSFVPKGHFSRRRGWGGRG